QPEQSERAVLSSAENEVEEFAKAAPLALFDYLRKSRNKGFVLSLSGGADSSSIAILVAEMIRRALHELGFERFQQKLGLPLTPGDAKCITGQLLYTAYQATVNSSEATLQS